MNPLRPCGVALTLRGAWTTCTLHDLNASKTWLHGWQTQPFSELSLHMCVFLCVCVYWWWEQSTWFFPAFMFLDVELIFINNTWRQSFMCTVICSLKTTSTYIYSLWNVLRDTNYLKIVYIACACVLIWLYMCICVFQVSADWERASLRPSSQPSGVFKPSPVMGTYTTEGGFINTNLVTADEESQEFDDLIFALKTGEDPTNTQMNRVPQTGSKLYWTFFFPFCIRSASSK